MRAYRRKLKEGDVLKDRYRIVRWLGEGGMGTVFLADDLRLPGKRWAVKETVSFGADHAGFQREADMLARLQHPRLPQIVDVYPPDVLNGNAYVVMEYIEGATLEEAMRRQGGPFPIEVVVRVGVQLAETLVYLHEQRPEPVVFRDVKPSNIMLDDTGGIRLIDFGIARTYNPRRMTDTVPLGTIGYAAPEQLRGEQSDPRSDLYAVGAVLNAMLHGGRTANVARKPLREMRPDVPIPLIELVDRLLEERPERRYQHAKTLYDDLRGLAAAEAASARSQGEPPAQPQLAPKLVLIGSLYPGAGSTFAAMAMAHALNSAGIPHAVCEHPAVIPELYALLYGERKAPSGYVFLAERIRLGAEPGPVWTEGHTLWIPSNPDADPESWNSSLTYEWLYEVRRPVIICDVSHRWSSLSVAMLLAKADEVLVVVDPTPSKLANVHSKKLLKQFAEMDGERTRVSFVANKDAPSSRRNKWVAMLPQAPAVSLPAFAAEKMLDAQWRGVGIPSGDKDKAAIDRAFLVLLRQWFPGWPVRKAQRLKWLQRRGQINWRRY